MKCRLVLPSVGFLVACLLLPTPPAQAQLINFNLAEPVIFSGDGSLSYDATTGSFHSSLVPLTYTAQNLPTPGSVSFSGVGQTAIDLKVNPAGQFLANGTGVQVMGALDFDQDGTADVSGVLLTGTITAFGSEAPGPPSHSFDGLFTIGGGALTGPIPLSGGGGTYTSGLTIGMQAGFQLTAEDVTGGVLGDFTADFASSAVRGFVGPLVQAVPEPGSSALLLVGGLGGAGLLRKRRRR